MKYLSIAVPCFNSQDYMHNCIESLLPGGDDVEILIVNDGSKDDTAKIANEYVAKYPNIIRVVHKENGGHGSAVNAGVKNATGKFFKVVDSDDWVDLNAYNEILSAIKSFDENNCPDMIVSNFVYEKVGKKNKKRMKYSNVMPANKIIGWDELRNFHKGQYLLMHSVMYNLDILRQCKLELPLHTFYVDNLYAYIPLVSVEKLYYVDVDFYRYFIGREDQSVQEKTMNKRIDQQLLVNKLMITSVDLNKIKDEHKQKYMLNYLEIVTMISTAIIVRFDTKENLQKRKELYDFMKNHDENVYSKIRFAMIGSVMNLPGWVGRKTSMIVYKIAQKIVGFN